MKCLDRQIKLEDVWRNITGTQLVPRSMSSQKKIAVDFRLASEGFAPLLLMASSCFWRLTLGLTESAEEMVNVWIRAFKHAGERFTFC